MRKRLMAVPIACALAGSMALFGCSSESSDSKEADKPADQQQAQPAQQEQAAKESKYAVSIDDCVVTTDYAGKPAIVVTYTFTNNSDKATAFFVAVSAKGFQNGVQLDTAVVTDIDSRSTINEIKAGATTTAQEAYLLDDQSEVSVECTELISLSDDILAEKTFSVA